jgi:uncharacterized protein (TIGR01777 family)
MKILVSGATGLVGSALCPLLREAGWQVCRLTRSPRSAEDVGWRPEAGELDRTALENVQAVVHLAGENVGGGRWNDKRKAAIYKSRVGGARLISQSIAQLNAKPGVFISASAIGYYGDRGDEVLDETSSPGEGFLADVCKAWEAATEPAAAVGTRVVNLRFGLVLSTAGGGLAQMLTPFKLGAGGRIGSGRQYVSWIAIDDVATAIMHALQTNSLVGPVNCVAPNPVTNDEFTRALGAALKRPTLMNVPAPVLRLALGEMADALLLSSTRAIPRKLQQSGYHFRYARLADALKHVLSAGETVSEGK